MFTPIFLSIALLAAAQHANQTSDSELRTAKPARNQWQVLYSRELEGNRQLVVETQDFPLDLFPEVASSWRPLPEGHRVVEPASLLSLRVVIEGSDGSRVPIFARVLQRYEGMTDRYGEFRVIGVQLAPTGRLFLSLYAPPVGIQVIVFSTLGGSGSTAEVMFRDIEEGMGERVAPQDLDFSLAGSLAAGDLALVVGHRLDEKSSKQVRFRIELDDDDLTTVTLEENS
jgi:hypothetical protein